jgi:hypothetical protein
VATIEKLRQDAKQSKRSSTVSPSRTDASMLEQVKGMLGKFELDQKNQESAQRQIALLEDMKASFAAQNKPEVSAAATFTSNMKAIAEFIPLLNGNNGSRRESNRNRSRSRRSSRAPSRSPNRKASQSSRSRSRSRSGSGSSSSERRRRTRARTKEYDDMRAELESSRLEIAQTKLNAANEAEAAKVKAAQVDAAAADAASAKAEMKAAKAAKKDADKREADKREADKREADKREADEQVDKNRRDRKRARSESKKRDKRERSQERSRQRSDEQWRIEEQEKATRRANARLSMMNMTPRRLSDVLQSRFFIPDCVIDRLERASVDGNSFMKLADHSFKKFCEQSRNPDLDMGKLRRAALELRTSQHAHADEDY